MREHSTILCTGCFTITIKVLLCKLCGFRLLDHTIATVNNTFVIFVAALVLAAPFVPVRARQSLIGPSMFAPLLFFAVARRR